MIEAELLGFLGLVILACTVHAVIGFGYSLVLVPLALVFLDKLVVVPAVAVVGLALNMSLALRIRAPVDRRLVASLLLPAALGLPAGLLVLRVLPVDALRIMAGLLVLIFATLLHAGRLRFPVTRSVHGIVGFSGGFLQLSLGMGGPPFVLMLAGRGTPRDTLRRTMAVLFVALALAGLLLLLITGTHDRALLRYGLASIPVAVAAGLAGDAVARVLHAKVFRRLVLLGVYGAGIVSLQTGAWD